MYSHNNKSKKDDTALDLIKIVQNKTDIPAETNRNVSDINSLRNKRWVEETQL